MSTKKSIFLCLGSLVLFFIAFLLFQSANRTSSEIPFESFLEKEEYILQNYIDELKLLHEQDQLFNTTKQYKELFDEESISIFILEEGVIKYWNESESPLRPALLDGESAYVKTNNSLHYLKRDSLGNKIFVAARQIARRYPYQNSYLQPSFSDHWLPYIAELKQLRDWKIDGRNDSSNLLSWLGVILLFIAIGLLVIGLPNLLSLQNERLWLLRLLLLLLALVLLNGVKWDHYLFLLQADFNYGILAKSSFDLLFNSLWGLLTLYCLVKITNRLQSFSLRLLYFIGFLFLVYLGVDLVFMAVMNTQINLELDNIFKLETPGLFIILSFGLIFLAALLLLKVSLRDKNDQKGWKELYFVVPGLFLLYLLAPDHLKSIIFLLAFSLFLFLYLNKLYGKLPELIYILLILIAFSLSTAYTVEKALKEKESSARRVLLQKLAEERDPLLEYLFVNLQEKIRTDKTLIQELDSRWDEKEIYKKYLQDTYFTGYWDRYRINITLCSDNDSIVVGANNSNRNCYEYFYDRIYKEGDQISSINLFQLSNLAGRIDYIGELRLDVQEDYRLYLELSRDYFSEDLGYPELFLNEEDKKLRVKLEEYAYAVYYQGELISSEGDYVYATSMESPDSSVIFYSYQDGEYDHTVLQKNENISIVLSKQQTSIFSYLSRVTYLLVLFGLLLLTASLVFSDFPFHFPLLLSDFSTKIRLLITSALLLALVFFILGTAYYIKQQYELKNSRAIEDKLRSISLELDQKLGAYDSLNTEVNPFVTSTLIKFSNVFYTDINLYDSTGTLYASSRPEIYNQDLKSLRMNPYAYQNLHKKNRSKHVQEESVGSLNYLSAYIPFKNRRNELLAYLNLPYFARQEELEEEISAFLAPTINSYVIIFTLALLISFLLINQISKPLLLIRRHISNLKLGGSTDLIEWQSDDEIGELVNEYNRIAIELGQSAAELAKSERETAWREMAKQIAHEIKNPLTPMKLSIQHLQHASKDPETDISDRIKRTSETLISQIDTLSNIAEAFSSFAKFPERDFQTFALLPIVEEVSHLYNSQADIKISSEILAEDSQINADRDIILRLFNNLIKNAIQANDKEGLAKIEIYISLNETKEILLEIKDYGKGISEEQMTYIFEPSFTTKSSGTGLGLAIVKRSMEQIGGRVEVSSTPLEQTSFFLYFPKA